MTSNIVLSNKEFNVVGTRPIRHDGYDKVTGKALYGADMNLPGMLHGKVLRSPHAHANIKSIDTSKAEAHPEVRAVITSADFPSLPNESQVLTAGLPVNVKFLSNNILAADKVLYKGHPVAAVVAGSVHAAEEALELIDVEYEVLPAVTNVEDALKSGAPQLHDEFEGNIASHIQLSVGDIEKGFNEAEVVVEREFRTNTVHQGYIEPHTATAWWLPDGRITVWCSSQGHFQMRDRTAGVLGIPSSRIRVVPMEIGGGFGGKTTIYLEPIAAALSREAGAPVKVTMNRAEVLEASGPTSGSYMKIKMGVTNDGKLTAAYADLKFEAGAYPGSPVGAAAQCIFSMYDLENVKIDGYDVVDNKPKTTAYRAPGSPIGSFGVEQVVDEICKKLSMDPLEFRLLNAAKEGTRRANGIVNPPIGCVETLQAIVDHDHYKTPLVGANRGRGVASGFWMNGAGVACATANVNYDGTVNLTIGSVDIGGTRPAAAQQFAEVLGIPVEDVSPQVGDTESIGYTSMTGGSGAAFKTGWASFEAAQDVKRQMIERAAIMWETDVSQIEFENGMFQHSSDPELKISFKDLAPRLIGLGGPVVGRANMEPSAPGSAFATHLVDVEVDPETGKVTVLRYTAAQDVGKAVHPSYVEGQIQGGVAQGIGWALNEEYYMNDDGGMMNSSLLDYRMPTSLDLPMINTVIVEVASPSHPYGVRGVGEVCIVPPLAAMANAIHDAIGTRMTELPMNPAVVSKSMADSAP
ncbi:MAG: xanthine dehydrogenase family protein molybdopterin-binding subunit [Chloroflexi bacterium]|nr:xanthine dehydrogenase family protein molybdopterin-binding subunit [Chloroflexota bacterium]MCI0790392.1 xanthine dehydrogenase family protein molybdopterin-binding subunit [Chloroflexota bacterium]MCI0821911.1 xanthine dehydrogenase family protein molybdopterin-binding subunit [Chloroflexota bacterium]MCI0868313.1 xanthine dehydrogenase family protein molybdopterin-binding subunit [Chloroflexota bacterium]